MEEVKGLKIKDILDCYNRYQGTVPTFRLAVAGCDNKVDYLYIKPEELHTFRASVGDIETYNWYCALFDVERTTIQGQKYMTKELIITFEIEEE